tara:strand:- start:2094 stop:2432 length:339 start_codon:yes stop_codon:yes gene_type:complete
MSEASKIIQVRVNTEFKRQVDSLTQEITDKIVDKKNHFRGYTVTDVRFFKNDLEEIFSENANSSQYGSPCTLKLRDLIAILITRGVEVSGKEKIAKNLVGKIEQFFKEEDSK